MNRPTRPALWALALILTAAGCSGGGERAAAPSEDLAALADRLAHRVVLVDTHIDVPYRLQEEMEDISERTAKGQFDFVRARQGGLDAPFMSIYVPASYQHTGGAKAFADGLIDMVEGFARRWPGKFAVVRSPDEVLRAKEAGKVALAMGMENGAPVEDDLGNLEHFYDRGIRYITLTHAENNQICDSSYADARTWHGLSPFGRRVVEEMNRLGIMVDVSHVSDETFDQVIELSRAPVIASHSSCRAFTPGWERNMSDDMIRRLAAGGGVIQINFGSAFLTEKANRASQEDHRAIEEHLRAAGIAEDSDAARAYRDEYRKEHPPTLADVSDVVAHIDHVVALVGVDHVGLGSDFDGVGDTTPTGLRDVAAYPNLIRMLLDEGYSEEDVEKICGGNLLRVWRRVDEVARQLRTPPEPTS